MAKTAEREEIRRRLNEEKERLQQELQGLEVVKQDGIDDTLEYRHYGNHAADIASDTYEAEKNLALESNLKRQIEATDAALARLEEGTYGICTNCGKPINPERLEALPQATLCIDCKRRQEVQR